ncbi:MAG: L-histidine N(alpha)-methyltransferase [Gammaproteobacteria bacterium]|nr:L-histidine N(alpha)-methyltransferase [Gammaproteobacteria bacterium]
MTTERYRFFDQNPILPNVIEEIRQGLRESPKRISPKYFYDEHGSALFEQITDLPEYYLTRTEIGILDEYKEELSQIIDKSCCLIEYGSGSSRKVRLLINAIAPRFYVPVDISREHLDQSARAIHDDFASLHVYPTCADYTQTLELPDVIDGAPRCGFFPGSSIGNFERDDAARFLTNLRRDIGPGGHCIIGFDSRKPKTILEAAYNDTKGVTASFNLNLLSNLNRTTGTDFDPSGFRHQSFYNETLGRIEMHLVSKTTQNVTLDGETFHFANGETIHTENSYKYSLDEVKALAHKSGMSFIKHWEDSQAWFYVVLLRVPDAAESDVG